MAFDTDAWKIFHKHGELIEDIADEWKNHFLRDEEEARKDHKEFEKYIKGFEKSIKRLTAVAYRIEEQEFYRSLGYDNEDGWLRINWRV